jgi:RNA polymerase-binding transcription factor DksA
MAINALSKDLDKSTRMPIHMAELGSEAFDQELTLSLLGSENSTLEQTEAAIARIEDGRYGRCETCGARIPESRLEAIPYAAQCVRCASQREDALSLFGIRRGFPATSSAAIRPKRVPR